MKIDEIFTLEDEDMDLVYEVLNDKEKKIVLNTVNRLLNRIHARDRIIREYEERETQLYNSVRSTFGNIFTYSPLNEENKSNYKNANKSN